LPDQPSLNATFMGMTMAMALDAATTKVATR
jgi:hypothetical protein